MKLCFFDYETTGLNGKGASWYPNGNIDAYTRPVSCCYIITDRSGQVLKKVYQLIKPIDEHGNIYTSGTRALAVHGITQAKGLEFGVDCKEFHAQFMEDLKDCDAIISHNGITFDIPIFIATCIRYGLAEQQFDNAAYLCMPKEKRFDTCKDANIKKFVGAINKRGFAKAPNMGEFHRKCFNKDFVGAHNAEGDVTAMMNCFFNCITKNVITFDDVIN